MQADLGDVVGVHDGHRVRRVCLGAGLVAEYPEGQHRGADGAVLGNERSDQRAVCGQVVGVELPGVHRYSASCAECGGLVGELIGVPRGQHHRRPGSQASREFAADLAAAAENYYRSSARVVHGCDYCLR